MDLEDFAPNITQRVEDLESRVDKVETGFVNNDPESHRRYHEALIKDTEARKRLTQAIQEKTISGLVWAGILTLGMACWTYLKALLKGNL